jgi:hypothetical protein
VIAAIPKEKARREAEQKAAAAAEAFRKQRRIEDAYCRGLDWVFRTGSIETYLVSTPRKLRWGGVDELISYCMGCFEAASMLREDINARVRDGRYARHWDDLRRHWEDVRRRSVAVAQRSAVKWRMADRLCRNKGAVSQGTRIHYFRSAPKPVRK